MKGCLSVIFDACRRNKENPSILDENIGIAHIYTVIFNINRIEDIPSSIESLILNEGMRCSMSMTTHYYRPISHTFTILP